MGLTFSVKPRLVNHVEFDCILSYHSETENNKICVVRIYFLLKLQAKSYYFGTLQYFNTDPIHHK